MNLTELEYLSEVGFTLNVEETLGLDLAFTKLQHESGANKVYFWGKIYGEVCDYFIAYILKKIELGKLPNKEFYYCTTTNYELTVFPEMDDWQKEQAQKPHGQLIGRPLEVISEKEIPNDDKSTTEDKPKAITFIEAHRLMNLVLKIDKNTAVIPKNSFILNGLVLEENIRFYGLQSDDINNLSNFYHLVPSEIPLRSNVVGKTGTIDIGLFLDPLSEDKPKGLWAVTYNPSKSITLFRNLEWPGYYFFIALNRPIYGGLYCGYGQPEEDLVFMI